MVDASTESASRQDLASSGLSPTKPSLDKRSRPSLIHSPSQCPPRFQTEKHVGFEPSEDGSGMLRLYAHQSIAILLGRSKQGEEEEEEEDDGSNEELHSYTGLGSITHKRISLPNSARHVSRNHATVFYLPFAPTRIDPAAAGSWVIKIMGQNGLIVDGKRRRPHQTLKLNAGKSTLDFFGVQCLFMGGERRERKNLSHEHSKVVDESSGRSPVKKRAEKARSSLGSQIGSGPGPFSRKPLGERKIPNTDTPMDMHCESQVDEKLLANESVSMVALKNSPSKDRTAQRSFVAKPNRRPLGAPPSPPTSSPAPFEAASSSPNHTSSINLRQPPGMENAHDEDPSDSDDGGEDRESPSSPTLERRAARCREGSADEASQALAAASKLTQDGEGRPQSGSSGCEEASVEEDAKQEGEGDGKESVSESEDENTPSPLPRVGRAGSLPKPSLKVKLKKVKFAPGTTPQGSDGSEARLRRSRTASQETPTIEKASVASQPSPLSAAQLASLQSRLRELVGQLAVTYDLEGLLAGAIVFHRTATISATEAVKSVLSSNPGLLRGEIGTEKRSAEAGQMKTGSILNEWVLEDDEEWERALSSVDKHTNEAVEVDPEERGRLLDLYRRRAWRECLEEVLQVRECFGIIQRAGKDASGNPLECWYYYDHEKDEDRERAANLGAFAKPIRGALKTHKPIFWKKSAYGHESTEANAAVAAANGSASQQAAQSKEANKDIATESQWGSSGNAIESLLVSGSSAKRGPSAQIQAEQRSTDFTAWEETQVQQEEKTWDKIGDLDYRESNGSRSKRRRR